MRMLRAERVLWIHDVFCDVRHQETDDDQHHADGPAHCCHGDDDVLHPVGREVELHAGFGPVGGVGPHAEAVGGIRVQFIE